MKFKNLYVISIFILICFTPVFYALGYAAFSGSGIRVVSVSENELVLEFQPTHILPDTLNIQNQAFLKATFDDAKTTDIPGQPALPYISFLIGIPENANITSTIIEADKNQFTGILPMPVPKLVNQKGFPVETFHLNQEFYNQTSIFPQNLIEIGEPALFRAQPVAQVKVYPEQVDLKNKLITLYSKIRFRLTFDSPQPAAAYKSPDIGRDEDYYADLLINYSQARKWRRKHSERLSKSVTGPFNSNTCIKIKIREDGFYKLSGSQLVAHGIDIGSIRPTEFRMYNNGGRPLPEDALTQITDSLIEIAIIVYNGNDGYFDSNDYILFYGQGTTGFEYSPNSQKFVHYAHPYTEENIYWLFWGNSIPGKRIETIFETGIPAEPRVKQNFRDFVFREDEIFNLLESGRIWVGRQLPAGGEKIGYPFYFKNAIQDSLLKVRVQIAVETAGSYICSMDLNSEHLKTMYINGDSDEFLIFRLNQIDFQAKTHLLENRNMINIGYETPQTVASSYIDWIEIEFSRRLIMDENIFYFNSSPNSGIIEFQIEKQIDLPVQLFDITDYANVKLIDCHDDGQTLKFIDNVEAGAPGRYVALTTDSPNIAHEIEVKTPANLRNKLTGNEYIIITPLQFMEAANILESLRENVDSLSTLVVDIQDIFDEFGWGLSDPVAIRNYLRYAYYYSWPEPRYVLLLGDGHYDYKKNETVSEENWIPPYYSNETMQLYNRVMDEWFVRVSGFDNNMDMAIGRLPVNTPEEALQVVQKICNYETQPVMGEWRNTITMVADDEFVGGGVAASSEDDHTEFAEALTYLIPRSFDIRKIYMIDYPPIYSAAAGGIVKPAVNEDLISQYNEGTLLMNIIGHSTARQFSNENVFTQSRDVPLLNNGNKLPFQIVASCEFGQFDSPTEQFISEEMLLRPEGGIIGTFASARLATSYSNYELNRSLLLYLLPGPTQTRRIGDAVMLAKNTNDGTNSQKYNLLGDPAMWLAAPRHSLAIKSVKPDSLKALSLATITGGVSQSISSSVNLNGKVNVKVFDTRQRRSFDLENGVTVYCEMPGNVIYRGTGTLVADSFSVQFIVPKDISYTGFGGRVSVYASGSETGVDGVGYLDNIYIGGTNVSRHDTEGPCIKIGFLNYEFKSGDMISENPVLNISIEDTASGINLTEDIGHKITMILDDDIDQKIDLTRHFQYNEGSYQKGKLQYPLTNLSEGMHRISVKAWDNFNNSAVAEAYFSIISDTELILRNVLNYPNPFSNETNFTLEINQPAKISVHIFTLRGRKIRQFSDISARPGFNVLFAWDGTDEEGDILANGVYLYRVSAESDFEEQKSHAAATGKIIVMK